MKTSTKMYLSIILSTICIMFYQYQLSKASLITLQENGGMNARVGANSRSNSGVILNDNSNAIDTNEVLNKIKKIKVIDNLLNQEGKILLTNKLDTSTSTTVKRTSTNSVHNVSAKLSKIVSTQSDDEGKNPSAGVQLPPPLYIITPTYRRPEQLAEITRLGYTLKHVPNLFWLVIEDATVPTPLVTKQLKRIGVPFEHLVAPMPNRFKKRVVKPRGVSNRNRGLAWIRKNATDGVFYFADDDNTYDLEIFDQMRHTKKVAMWPVGLVTKFGLSSPIVRGGKLTGFYDGWIGGRKYPVDMAGFAVNVKFFLSRPKAIMPYDAGYEEDKFLRSLAPLANSEIELLASNCTEILTWHTQTKKNPVGAPLDMHLYNGTNLVSLRKIIV